MQYPDGSYYDLDASIMYYADGTSEYMDTPPNLDDPAYAYYPPAASIADLQAQAASAAEAGTLDTFSQNLLKLGTTAAQLAMFYQNVQSSKQLTPVALQNLAQERAALQTQSQSSQTTWMWVGLAAAAALVFVRERRRA